MKIVFMGTPDFAAAALESLMKSHQVAAVVTQPDRKKGRGNKVQSPPVKVLAIKNNIPVYQPEKVNNSIFVDELEKLGADIFVVAAFGQLLGSRLLNMAKYGAINIHASLLPKYRGASPIQQAILNGDKTTGITIMAMDKGLDTGDILLKGEIDIHIDDNAASLHDKLAELGASTVLEALADLEAGRVVGIKQEEAMSSYAPLIKKEDGLINWCMTSAEIFNRIRAMNPWPAAYTYLKGAVLKIFASEIIEGGIGVPGEVVEVIKNTGFTVKTLDGVLLVKEVQAPGGKRMAASEYIKGASLKQGDRLGG